MDLHRDAIVTPTTPSTAWAHDATTVEIAGGPESALAGSWRLTYPFNLTGMPAISLPCGFDRDGLQIVAKPFDEAMVLRVAQAYEKRHDWCTRRPRLQTET